MRTMSGYEGQVLGVIPLHKMCPQEESLPFPSRGHAGLGVGAVSPGMRLWMTWCSLIHSGIYGNWKSNCLKVPAPGVTQTPCVTILSADPHMQLRATLILQYLIRQHSF